MPRHGTKARTRLPTPRIRRPAPIPRPDSVHEYLRAAPTRLRKRLRELRRTIRSAAPGAEEALSYGMPAFRYRGMLVYYAAFRDHVSFFPGSVTTLRRFARHAAPYLRGKGTMRFDPERPLPLELIRRIVRARVRENVRRTSDAPTVRRPWGRTGPQRGQDL